MTNRYPSVCRGVLVAMVAAAIVLVPVTSALAQRSIDDMKPSSGASVSDGNDSVNTGDGSNIHKIRSYARSNYVWPYSSGPRYPSVDVNQQGVVETAAGVFQLQGALGIASELRTENKLADQASQYFVVQYHTDVAAEAEESLRTTIERNGGVVITSPNAGSMVAKLTLGAHSAVQSAVGVLAVEPYHGAFKLNPKIGRTPLPDPMRALSDIYTLEVVLWRGEDSQAAAQAVAEVGGTVTRTYGDSLVVELHRSLLPQLAAIDAVASVNESLPYHPMGEETTTTMQTGQYNAGATPFHDAGITGAGLGLCPDLVTPCEVATQGQDCGLGQRCIAQQILMVLDSGIQLDAGDLSDTKVDGGTPGFAHRKIRAHQSTDQFGGQGDLSGCDSPPQGGFTHGHVVAATALGNATDVDTDYGATGWIATDPQGNPWKLDGVAPGAVLVAYDGQITPPNGSCSDPLLDSIIPGDLYDPAASANGPCPGSNCPGALGKAYEQWGARVFNLPWGSLENTYTAGALDIDTFMFNKRKALVMVSAGNQGADVIPDGGDGIPDPETLGAPATTKNGFAIGASRNANTTNSPESRAFFSSTGPAVDTTTNRIAPQLMAPGDELGGGNLGVSSEFTCRSNDNDQNNPVECDIISGAEGTSFSAPAASGAALLAIDYFAQGFHPKAVQTPNDRLEVG